MRVLLLMVVLVLAAQPSVASAATACKGIADPTKRLACYDQLERDGGLDKAAPMPQTVAPAPSERDPALFGIPATRSPNDALNNTEATSDQAVVRDDDGMVESLTSAVAEYSVSADRMVTVILANGQVWRQVSGRELWLKDEPSANVVKISRTMLGGFSMTVNGKNDVAIVRRLDGKRPR